METGNVRYVIEREGDCKRRDWLNMLTLTLGYTVRVYDGGRYDRTAGVALTGRGARKIIRRDRGNRGVLPVYEERDGHPVLPDLRAAEG